MTPTLLLDIDNTLTPPRQRLREEMATVLSDLSLPFHVAAGSNMDILYEQFFQPLHDFGFRKTFQAFINNGASHFDCDYSSGISMKKLSDFELESYLGLSNFQYLITVLRETEQKEDFRIVEPLEVMGETIGYRGSMINFVPIGRVDGTRFSPAYQTIRNRFIAFDLETGYRHKILRHLKRELLHLRESHKLTISLGGQTSFDISIASKDKTNAVWTLLNQGVEQLVFIGDALYEHGNDEPVRELAERWPSGTPCPIRTIQVDGWQETIKVVHRLENWDD